MCSRAGRRLYTAIGSKSIDISTWILRDVITNAPDIKSQLIAMSSTLHLTDFGFFSLLSRIGSASPGLASNYIADAGFLFSWWDVTWDWRDSGNFECQGHDGCNLVRYRIDAIWGLVQSGAIRYNLVQSGTFRSSSKKLIKLE